MRSQMLHRDQRCRLQMQNEVFPYGMASSLHLQHEQSVPPIPVELLLPSYSRVFELLCL